VSGALHLGQTFTASHSRYRIVTVARKPPRGETALTSVKVVWFAVAPASHHVSGTRRDAWRHGRRRREGQL